MRRNQYHNKLTMIPLFRPALLAVVLASTACEADANSLALTTKERWLVVASTKDVDAAIGIAGHYSSEGPRVVAAQNGWFAVVMGPYRAHSVRELIERKQELPVLPQDALLSRGSTYQETIWQHKQKAAPIWKPYNRREPVILKSGNIEITVSIAKAKIGQTTGLSTVTGQSGGKTVFQFPFGDVDAVVVKAKTAIVRLDGKTDFPQIVLTNYSGGDHCCTKTWVVTRPAGKSDWILLDAGELDGEGFGFRDLNQDGVFEIAQYDNDFLYTFDSYAGSFAPVNYLAMSGDQLINISGSEIAGHALKQDIASLEFDARLDPENWKHNGFLAAWVASKVRLGQGEDAWATMLENFDRNSEFNQQECLTGAEMETCDPKLVQDIPFPKALARFLNVTGYGPLPQSAIGSAN
jgi:serine protease Do